MTRLPLLIAITLASLGAAGRAQPSLGPAGHLERGACDGLAVLPTGPMPTAPRGLADRAIVRMTRALQGDPAFTADLAAARHEIATFRQDGDAAQPGAALCTRETACVAHPLH